MNFQGTFQGYESIAPYRLYLDTSCNDIEFKTALPNPLFITEKSVEKPTFESYGVVGNFYNPPRKIWDVISTNDKTKKFSDILKGYRVEHLLNGSVDDQITLFVPVEDIDSILYNMQKFPYTMENILKAHMVNYPILPVQLFGQINRIESKLKTSYITILGTNDQLFIVHPNDRFYRNKILRTEKTDNGYIYYISRAIIPDLY